MALPTTNLTLHCDASDTDKLFTTYSAAGTHSGTPSDGNAVQVWDDEGDGIADVALVFPSATREPLFRSGASALMKTGLTELDYDGTNDELQTYVQDGDPIRASSDFISNSAATLAMVFYPEVISDTDT